MITRLMCLVTMLVLLPAKATDGQTIRDLLNASRQNAQALNQTPALYPDPQWMSTVNSLEHNSANNSAPACMACGLGAAWCLCIMQHMDVGQRDT